jgi:WD40 repeat protein
LVIVIAADLMAGCTAAGSTAPTLTATVGSRGPSLVATLRGHTDAVATVAFSPDGHTLATGSSDRTMRTWKDDRLIEPFGRVGPGYSSSRWAAAPE